MSLGNVLHAVALCTTGIVFAGDGQVATLQTVGNVETLYTASYWSNGISPTNDAAAGWDYVAETGSVRMPEIANVFKCNSMTFGTDTKRLDFYAKTGTSTFENDGLHLVRTSSQCWTSGAMTLGGKVSFDGEPSSITFQGLTYGSGNGRGTWRFSGPLASEEGKGFKFYTSGGIVCSNRVELLGDLTAFNGTIEHTADNGTLVLTNSPLPGTVHVGTNAILAPCDAGGLAVGTLDLAAGAIIKMTADRQTGASSTNRVTRAVSVAGPVKIWLEESDSCPTNELPVRYYPVLTLSESATGSLDKDDFALEVKVGQDASYYELVDEDGDGNAGVFIKHIARVKWVTGDQPMDGGQYWSDGMVPSPDKEYVCPLQYEAERNRWSGMNIRTPSTSGIYTFTGKRLDVYSGNLIFQSYTSVFTNLVLHGGTLYMWHEYGDASAHPDEVSGGTRWVKGNVSLLGDVNFYLSVNSYMELDAAFSGGSALTLNGTDELGSWFSLNAFNTNFTGQLILKGNSSADVGKISRVVFSDARNFGDSPETFQYARINIQSSRMLLRPSRTMVLDTGNRGILVYDGGFDVPEGLVLTQKSVVSYNGTFRKAGGGVLAFAAPMTLFGHSTANAAAANFNSVLVHEGHVMGGNTNATAGLAFTFSGNAGIAASLAEEDEATRLFGLYDEAWDSPVTVGTDDGKLHVKVLPDADGEYPTSFSVPFLTVKSSAAEALEGKFVVDSPAKNMFGAVSVRTNANGTKTFVADVALGGMTIIFR